MRDIFLILDSHPLAWLLGECANLAIGVVSLLSKFSTFRSGLIAAGGQRTEIYIAPISSLASAPERGAWELSTSFRGSINNSIFITNLTLSTNPYASTYDDLQYMSSVNPRLFVSNNDQSLRVFNIATNLVCSDTGKSIARLSKAGAVELKTCVNHCECLCPSI